MYSKVAEWNKTRRGESRGPGCKRLRREIEADRRQLRSNRTKKGAIASGAKGQLRYLRGSYDWRTAVWAEGAVLFPLNFLLGRRRSHNA